MLLRENSINEIKGAVYLVAFHFMAGKRAVPVFLNVQVEEVLTR
jgi:hypothetical protein